MTAEHASGFDRLAALCFGGRRPARGLAVLLLALALVVITALAVAPAPPQSASLGWDKLNHASAFAVLALLSGATVQAQQPLRRASVGMAFGLLAYGLFIEVVQSFVPSRSAEPLDLLADAVGIALGLGLWLWLRARASRVPAAAG